MTPTFTHPFVARFRDTDPANIVYFANYLDFFHRTLEAYFDEIIEIPYADLIQTYRLGVPVVHVEGDYAKPIPLGEHFWVALTPLALGKSSLRIRYEVWQEGNPLPNARFVLVHVMTSLTTFTPTEIPSHIREKILIAPPF